MEDPKSWATATCWSLALRDTQVVDYHCTYPFLGDVPRQVSHVISSYVAWGRCTCFCDRDSYDLDSYDRVSYDLDSYDLDSYDRVSYDRVSYDRVSYDRVSYDRVSYDRISIGISDSILLEIRRVMIQESSRSYRACGSG
jgi:hypothetical protein